MTTKEIDSIISKNNLVFTGLITSLGSTRDSRFELPGLVKGGRPQVLAYIRLMETLLKSVRGSCRSSDLSLVAAHLYLMDTLAQFFNASDPPAILRGKKRLSSPAETSVQSQNRSTSRRST